MNTRQAFAALAVAATAALTVGGCSKGGIGRTESADAPAVDTAGGGSAGYEARQLTPDGKGGVPAGAPNAVPSVAPAGNTSSVAGPALIKTGDLAVRVEGDIVAKTDRAKQIVTAARGTLHQESASTADGTRSTVDLVFKVPPDSLDAVMSTLGKELGEVVSRTASTQDVTEQVADVESRVASAKASITQLRALFDRARTVGDVLSLERELATRQAELESLQARQRALSAQTETATLSLHLRGKDAPTTEEDEEGFLAGLKDGWDAFTNMATGLATALGAVLPFAVLALVLSVPLWLVARRSRRLRMPAPQPE